MDLKWPTNSGPRRAPHPFTLKIIKRLKNGAVLSHEGRLALLKFEAFRRQLTYKELALLSRDVVYTSSVNPGLSEQTIGKMARAHGIVRHVNPTTKRNDSFFALRTAG